MIIRERGSSWAGRNPVALIHSSWEEAQAELVDYVRENWDAKMEKAIGCRFVWSDATTFIAINGGRRTQRSKLTFQFL